MAGTGNLIRKGLRKLPDTWAALIVVGAILMAGMGMGVFWAQQKGLPGRVERLEFEVQRSDSIRNTYEAREVLSGRLTERVQVLERDVNRQANDLAIIKDQNRRIICLLQGNRGPSCL
jgi:hypothetical protein